MKSWRVLWLLGVLSGCGGLPASSGGDNQTPVSQRTMTDDASRSAKAHADLGMGYLREGQLNIALDEAHKAIAIDASYAMGYNLLGVVQMYLLENKAAEEAFAEALRLEPNDPEINNNYGWFLCQTKREIQSYPYFTAASRNTLYQVPTKPLTNAAICAITSGDDKLGEEFLIKALRADAENLEARFLLAELMYRSGRYFDAKQQLTDVLRIIPTSQSLWLALRIERKLGNSEEEGRYASQLRREYRDSREYQYLKQGNFQ